MPSAKKEKQKQNKKATLTSLQEE